MLGWYLDEIIVFVFRTLIRFLRERNTRTWPRIEGQIHTSGPSSSFYPAAEMTYFYSVNGQPRAGSYRRAFFFHNSAKEYTKRFIPKYNVTIRYSKDDPSRSFVSMHDQVATPVWATRYREE